MKALAFSFTLMQYDAETRVRDSSAPKFILDVVNNSTLIAVIGPSKTVSSIVTKSYNFSQRHTTKFVRNITFLIKKEPGI